MAREGLHYAIVRRMLVNVALFVFLTAQNAALVVFYSLHRAYNVDMAWEVLLINVAELFLCLSQYSQTDFDTAENLRGEVWERFASPVTEGLATCKMVLLALTAVCIPVALVWFACTPTVTVLRADLCVFGVLYLYCCVDMLVLSRIAARAVGAPWLIF